MTRRVHQPDFTDENPPSISEAQWDSITCLLKGGAKVQQITLHPYSGAATISDSWRPGGGTIAIVGQDGSYGYIGKGYPKSEWTERVLRATDRSVADNCEACRSSDQ